MKRRSFLGRLGGAAALLVLGLRPPEPDPVLAWWQKPAPDLTIESLEEALNAFSAGRRMGKTRMVMAEFKAKAQNPEKWVGVTS